MTDYWPWWAGALALGALTALYPALVGSRLGVSGAWDRVVHWRREQAVDRMDAALDDADFDAVLAAATVEAFGADSIVDGPTTAVDAAGPTGTGDSRRLPVSTQAVFLVAMFVGGLAAALASGRFELRTDMGPAFAAVVTDGPLLWPVLFGGGLLVGFGTRLAGGCSSGHGLSGCSRLEPVSLVATATFFAAASATSFLLWKVI